MSSREIGMFYFNRTIEKLFLSRATSNVHHVELNFEDIVAVDDWWSITETTFLHGVAKFSTESSHNITISGNVLFGLPRLRQIRIRNESCRINKVFHNDFQTCYGDYSKDNEYVGEFLNTSHFTQSEASTYNVWGLVSNYHGGGFIEMLSMENEVNEDILQKLKESNWIDEATRVILIEFALFNANVNLFCNAKLYAEITASGGIVPSSHLQTLKLNPLWNDEGFLVPFCLVVFLAFVLYYTLKMMILLASFRFKSIFASMFTILDLCILLITYFAIGYMIWHKLFLNSILDKYGEDKNQYLSLDIACFWNFLFIDLMGLCVFLVWIKVFKYIRFNKTMMQFSTTLQRCSKDLLGFSVMFAVAIVAYAFVSVAWFGSTDSDFNSISSAILTLFRAVLGDFDYGKLETVNRVLGPIFFLSYISLVFFVLLNMFLAIINDTYTDVKSEITHGEDNAFEDYIKHLLSRLKTCLKPGKKSDMLSQDQPEETTQVPKSSSVVSEISNQTQALEEPSRPHVLTNNAILNSLFEVVSFDREGIKDPLTDRVTLLEMNLEKLVAQLDEVLMKINKKDTDLSNRSL